MLDKTASCIRFDVTKKSWVIGICKKEVFDVDLHATKAELTEVSHNYRDQQYTDSCNLLAVAFPCQLTCSSKYFLFCTNAMPDQNRVSIYYCYLHIVKHCFILAEYTCTCIGI